MRPVRCYSCGRVLGQDEEALFRGGATEKPRTPGLQQLSDCCVKTFATS